MSDLENKIFVSIKKPPIYQRYVDDILILANNINEINILQDTFVLGTYNPNLIELILKPVLMYLNVFSY